MILAGVSSFQVCKLGCKILISGLALSGSRLPRSPQNGSFLVTGFHAFLFSFTVLRAASMRGLGSHITGWQFCGTVRLRNLAPYDAWTHPPQSCTLNLPCHERKLWIPEGVGRLPDGMCVKQQPWRRTGAVLYGRLSAVRSACPLRYCWLVRVQGRCFILP